MGDQPIARPLPTHRTTRTQNKRKQASMPAMGFEPTISVLEQAKTVHASGRTATVATTELHPKNSMECGPIVGFCEHNNEHSSSIQVLNLTSCTAIPFSSIILSHMVNESANFTLDAEFSWPLF
jgi:hypothetical protein